VRAVSPGIEAAPEAPTTESGASPSPAGQAWGGAAERGESATVPPLDELSVDASVEPASTFFPGQVSVRYAEFLDAIREIAAHTAQDADVLAAYRTFLSEHTLSESEAPLESFSRIRLLFEATRDGGLWGLRWAITDRMPWSDAIWTAWKAASSEGKGAWPVAEDAPTAIAECDELSALFALLARDIGVQGFVALHWPTWNHTVAVWQLQRSDGSPSRIVVPTSQIFLSRGASLGTREFETRRVLFPYARHDLKPESPLPGPLVRFLLSQLVVHGGASDAELQARRNRLGSS
jgi:hypothetical protein